jgi:hypothetical protein
MNGTMHDLASAGPDMANSQKQKNPIVLIMCPPE